MYRWHAFSYEWFCTKTRFARGKSQLFIHELLREPLIYERSSICQAGFTDRGFRCIGNVLLNCQALREGLNGGSTCRLSVKTSLLCRLSVVG